MRAPVAVSVLLALSASLLPAAAASGDPAPTAASSTSSAWHSSSTSSPATPMTALPAPATVREAAPRFPGLRVTTLADGLDHPWDVQALPGEGLLVSERDRTTLSILDGGVARPLVVEGDPVWVSGETGLMGLAVDPGFSENRRFYTCQGGFTGDGGNDVRVVAWRLSDDDARAVQTEVLLAGIQATSGRHGGCRLLITRAGALVVGTGDAAVPGNPQDRTSLNGKTLRLDRFTGRPSPGNPYAGSADPQQRYVLTYGHRNVQGLAQRPDGTLWSVEHGTNRDDEVNLLRAGGNYGWDPGPGYTENGPMTDYSLPGKQLGARWSSGNPTIAPSGATFVTGAEWGAYRGRLAVAVLGDTKMMFQRYDARGRLQGVKVPRVLAQQGRLRAVTQLPGGALVVTTDNGGGRDRVLRVVPRP